MILFTLAIGVLAAAWMSGNQTKGSEIDFATFRNSYERGKVVSPFEIPAIQKLGKDMAGQPVTEVRKAPLRRVDNLITTLYDDTRMLRTHIVVAEAVRAAHSSAVWKARLSTAGVLCAGAAISGALASTGALLEFGAGMGLLTAVATGFTAWQGSIPQYSTCQYVHVLEADSKKFLDLGTIRVPHGTYTMCC